LDRERRRWEERYAASAEAPSSPASVFLRESLQRLPRGQALDVACGEGRHTIFLARHGYRVDAIDLALTALQRLHAVVRRERLPVALIQANLEDLPLPPQRYDVILNMRYLQRSLWSRLKQALRPGGLIVFETFTSEQRRFGHPTNPAFLLQPGELRRFFADHEILHYTEGLFDTEAGPAYLARMLARRPGPD